MKKILIFIYYMFITTIAFGQNLILNPGFEDGTTTNWTEIGASTMITRSSLQKHSGTYSCMFKDPTSTYNGRGVYSDKVQVTAENNYDLWGWFYVANDGGGSIEDTDLRLRVFWLQNDQSTPCDPASNPSTTGWNVSSFNNWTKKEFNNLQAPANAAYAYVQVECHEDSNNDNDVFIDDIQFGSAGTLPVELSTFTAQYLNNVPTLYWVTQSETDNIGWYVYRNTQNDFITSMIISDLIPGYGTTSEPHSYIYEDYIENAFPGDTYWYWLESIDYGGMINHYDKVAHIVIPENYDPGNENPEEFEEFGLFQSNPNPFNPKTEETTEISFSLKENSEVQINIYNVKGELVKTIYDGFATSDETVWDGKDENGNLQATGIYLYELKVNNKMYSTKRIILIR